MAAVLRVTVARSVPGIFGPGDPAIYFAMARGCVQEGVPRIGFVWHFLTWPAGVIHVEDYYEPAFAYLLALPMLLTGAREASAQAVSVVAGVSTVLLVFLLARRFSIPAALTAAALVAVEPWSVYYGGLIMKEATVAALVLLFLLVLLRGVEARASTGRQGLLLAAATLGAALFQYELLPILAGTSMIVLAVHRRAAIPAYVVGIGLGAGALMVLGERLLGVPISAKTWYFLGRDLWTPDGFGAFTSRPFLPLPIAPARLVGSWYPILIILAAVGALQSAARRLEVTAVTAYGACFLYFHGVAQDLWPRDFVTLTPVAAPLAGLALTGTRSWRARPWAPSVLAATVTLAAIAPHASRAFRDIPWDAPAARLWPPLLGITLVIAGAWLAGRLLRRWRPPQRLATALPTVLVLALLVEFSASLAPWEIYRNGPFRGYETARAERERVGRRLGRLISGATVMSSAPWEIQLYSGLNSVLLPVAPTPQNILRVRSHYGVDYLLILVDELPATLLGAVGAREAARLEGYRLYRLSPTS